MSEVIVNAIEETMIPEVIRLGKMLRGVISPLAKFTEMAQEIPEVTFYKVCNALNSQNTTSVELDDLERLSSDLVGEIGIDIVEAVATQLGLDSGDTDKVLAYYSHRLAIVTGSFRIKLYDPLVHISGIQHDKEDFDALTRLASEINTHFVTPINEIIPLLVTFMKLFAIDDGSAVQLDELNPTYIRWQAFALNVLVPNITECIIKTFFKQIGQFAEKQIYLADSGFNVEEFNSRQARADEAFEEEAKRKLTLDEFGVEPIETPLGGQQSLE
jgi:hypothetical protein